MRATFMYTLTLCLIQRLLGTLMGFLLRVLPCCLAPWGANARSVGTGHAGVLRALLFAWVLGVGLAPSSWAAEAKPLAQDPVLEQRMISIAQELRCLVCQNESLASSRADLAEDLRREVRGLLQQGKSDEEIKAYLVARYGDFVLYRPQLKPMTWVLWFGPLVALLIGLLGLVLYVKRGQLRQAQEATKPLSEAERARLADLLKDGRGL
jgi:cytochrome c-type biogenesis protein CcmH